MGFIEFPFIEVPKDLRKIVGEPTTGTRAYRREGTHAECGQWIEDLGFLPDFRQCHPFVAIGGAAAVPK